MTTVTEPDEAQHEGAQSQDTLVDVPLARPRARSRRC